MDDYRARIWHKDGPVAQVEAMADWLDEPLDAEHRRKVQANLRASADVLRGAVDALREIAQGEWAGWASSQPRHIAREALEAIGVDPSTNPGGR